MKRVKITVLKTTLDRELAAVLMAISVTTRSIARNIHLLSMQRHVKGVNPYDKR